MFDKIRFSIRKENRENKEMVNVLACVNDLVLENPFEGDLRNKLELYNSIQKEWHGWVEERGLLKELEKGDKVNFTKELSARVRKFKGGFGSSPKLYGILPEKVHGLDCLSFSMAVGSVLEREGIEYNYISPVGHVALLVKIEGNNYYCDIGRDRFIPMDELIEEVSKGEHFDIIYFKQKYLEKFYGFVAKFKNKEDIVGSVLGNILVLDDILKNKTGGSSRNLTEQTLVAQSVKEKLFKIDMRLVSAYRGKTFPNFYDQNPELCKKEEKRLNDIRFYP